MSMVMLPWKFLKNDNMYTSDGFSFWTYVLESVIYKFVLLYGWHEAVNGIEWLVSFLQVDVEWLRNKNHMVLRQSQRDPL